MRASTALSILKSLCSIIQSPDSFMATYEKSLFPTLIVAIFRSLNSKEIVPLGDGNTFHNRRIESGVFITILRAFKYESRSMGKVLQPSQPSLFNLQKKLESFPSIFSFFRRNQQREKITIIILNCSCNHSKCIFIFQKTFFF